MGASDNKEITYNVEALYSDITLIRPSDTGFLTLVNRSTGDKTQTFTYTLAAPRL